MSADPLILASPSTPVSSASAFEFTKRKKWAEILITELAGCLVVVLTPSGHVLFCARSVRDVLGWKEAELVDRHISEIVHPEEAQTLRWQLDSRQAFESIVRMRPAPPPAPAPADAPVAYRTFELLARPHTPAHSETPTCFVACARPHPGRFAEVFNAMYELKVENQHLTQRLRELEAEAPTALDAQSSAPYDFSDPLAYGAPPAQPQTVGPVAYGGGGDDLGGDGAPPRKRPRTVKQLVCATCGRTDSPEWRKGPQGPKTLCNACGLRYAKNRKTDADAA